VSFDGAQGYVEQKLHRRHMQLKGQSLYVTQKLDSLLLSTKACNKYMSINKAITWQNIWESVQYNSHMEVFRGVKMLEKSAMKPNNTWM
jgi:hypothetical protein